jgi:hypothetical protein
LTAKALPDILSIEVWILDYAKDVTKRILERCGFNTFSDVLDRLVYFSAQTRKTLKRHVSVGDAPICESAVWAGGAVGDKPQLESSYRVPDVKRLIEVRIAA